MVLDHRLIIPISPSQFESAHWVEIMMAERQVLMDLLLDMGLTIFDHYGWIKCLADDGRHCHVLYFATIHQAMLFKLRYGGACQYVHSSGPGKKQPE